VDRWRAGGHDEAVITSSYRVDDVDGDGPASGVERSLPPVPPHAAAPARHRRLALERAARRTVDAALDREKPDVVAVWNVAGIPLSAVRRVVERGVPTMFVVADAWPMRVAAADPWVVPFTRSPLRRAAGRVAAALTGVPTDIPRWSALGRWAFCSESLRRQVAAATGDPFTGAAVVPLGVDPRDFPSVPPGGSGGRGAAWGWRLLFVGRLDPAKGIDTLVRALAGLPEAAELEVCGPDEPEHVARIRRLADELGVAARVHIAPVPRHELAARYRAADVCVFPSEWEEPFGIVPLEAMSCATPVVASGTGGSADYLRDGENCLIAAPGDPGAIVSALHRLADDPELRQRLLHGGRGTARSFTVDRLAATLERLATDLIASG
jgi:glycosyltransferase involved in cell wall biosynthesis